jgi:hypothetical protein
MSSVEPAFPPLTGLLVIDASSSSSSGAEGTVILDSIVMRARTTIVVNFVSRVFLLFVSTVVEFCSSHLQYSMADLPPSPP